MLRQFFFCSIKAGILSLKNKKKFLSDVKASKDGEYILTLEPKSKKRSVRQNKFLYGVVFPICRQGLLNAGYRVTVDQAKQHVKNLFLKTLIVNEETGEYIELTKSTADLSTTEMMDFIAAVQQYAAEQWGVYIPDPNEFIEA